eukprot:47789_1
MLEKPLCDNDVDEINDAISELLGEKPHKTKATSSLTVCIINTIKLCIGSGILSLPWAFRYGSLWPSIIAILFSSIYNLITSMFLIHACEITHIFEYSSLLQFIGPIWEICGVLSICYVTFSTCLSYMILIGQFIKPTFIHIFNINSFPFDKQIYILIFVIIILYPLSLIKNLNSLRFSSITGIIAIFYCVCLLIYKASNHNTNTNSDSNGQFVSNQWNLGVFIAINICAKAFVCQYSLPSIYESMRNRSIRRMCIVMSVSYSVITIIYLIFAICGYYIFRTDTKINIFENFATDYSISISIARICISISLCGCFPLVFKAGINAIENKFFNENRNVIWNFNEKPFLRIFMITFIILFITILSLFLNNINAIISINVAISALFLICVFPILVIWRLGFYGDNLKNVTKQFEYMRGYKQSMDDMNINKNDCIEMNNVNEISNNGTYMPKLIGMDGYKKMEDNDSHMKQETMVINEIPNDIFEEEDEEEVVIDDINARIVLKNGKDICKSIIFSWLLFIGVLFGIIGVIMFIVVIHGWY